MSERNYVALSERNYVALSGFEKLSEAFYSLIDFVESHLASLGFSSVLMT